VGGEEVDFENEQKDEVRVEIPQDILRVVERSVMGDKEEGVIEPVEALSATFLQSLVSDKMEIDLGEQYMRSKYMRL